MKTTTEQSAAFAAITEAEQLIIKKAISNLVPIFTDEDRAAFPEAFPREDSHEAEAADREFALLIAAHQEEAEAVPTDDKQNQEEEHSYTGPMLRLRERLAQGAYLKAKNGQPCCGDRVADLLGSLPPARVIQACILAMALPANPYAHLNVGQQSMNLRNKLRGCFKREEFGFGVLVEAVEQVQEEAAAQIAAK